MNVNLYAVIGHIWAQNMSLNRAFKRLTEKKAML